MLSIKNNIMAANAARHLGKAYDGLAKSVERLSSGLRINSAKDDAAGLAVRELIRADIAVQNQGSRNAQDGISMLQTMEGAMGTIDANLVRMKELAEQAATGSYSAGQRTIMNAEFAEMASAIDRIANNTSFNSISMINSSTGSVAIHVGTATTIDVDKVDMTESGLGIETGSGGTTIQTDTSNGVDSASAGAWLTITDNAASTYSLNIQFTDADSTNEEALAVDLTTASGVATFTLNDVVDAINLVSQNLGNDADGNDLNYTAAEAVLDSGSGKYVLKLSSRTSLADGVTATGELDSGYTSGAVSGGFNETGGASLVDGTTAGNFDAADTSAAGLNILTATDAASALSTITAAISTKDAARASFGYKMNRLEGTVSVLGIQAENLAAAESRISDADVATEMADLPRSQVLAQAGISMLAQANAMPQMALMLLR